MDTSAMENRAHMMCCASCGIARVDDITLKDCDGCDFVKYCSDECREDHRPQHKKECKKRAAELRDELLFKQPESSHLGDCPICCLPLPIYVKLSTLMTCCSKRVCYGCNYANQKRQAARRLHPTCPFCRKPLPETEEEADEQAIKRIEVNDPVAMCHIGTDISYKGDYRGAFEYFTKAAALGDIQAHYQLSTLYGEGKGVEKDEEKELHHLTEAAIGGCYRARYNLGWIEKQHGRLDRAAKHYIIAAKLGCDKSLKSVTNLYKAGYVSKDDFAAALRGHQAAVDATKSPQREEAYEFFSICM